MIDYILVKPGCKVKNRQIKSGHCVALGHFSHNSEWFFFFFRADVCVYICAFFSICKVWMDKYQQDSGIGASAVVLLCSFLQGAKSVN